MHTQNQLQGHNNTNGSTIPGRVDEAVSIRDLIVVIADMGAGRRLAEDFGSVIAELPSGPQSHLSRRLRVYLPTSASSFRLHDEDTWTPSIHPRGP